MNWDFLNALAPMGQTQQVIASIQAAGRQQQQLDEAKRQHQAEMSMRLAEMQQRQDQFNTGHLQSALENGGQGLNDQGMVPTSSPAPSRDLQLPTGQSLSLDAGPAVQGQMPVNQGQTMNFGGRQVYMPTQQEQAQQQQRSKLSLQDALDQQKLGTFGVPVGGDLADFYKMKPGQMVLPEKEASLQTAMARQTNANTRANAEPKVKDQLVTDDHGNMSYVSLGADGKPNVVPVPNAKGKSRESMNIQVGGQTANSRAVDVRQSLTEINKLEDQEADLHSMRKKLGTAIASGKLYVDKNGNVKSMEKTAADVDEQKDFIEEMKQRYDDATTDVAKVIQKKNQLYGQIGKPVSVSTDQAKQALQGGTGQQAKALTDPKVAQQYLQKAGGDKGKARQLAQADGWKL